MIICIISFFVDFDGGITIRVYKRKGLDKVLRRIFMLISIVVII